MHVILYERSIKPYRRIDGPIADLALLSIYYKASQRDGPPLSCISCLALAVEMLNHCSLFSSSLEVKLTDYHAEHDV